MPPCAALPSSGLAQSGFNLSDGNVLESPGPVSGVATDFKNHETQRPDMMVQGQVRRHAHPVGIGHVSCFQHLWFQALWILEKRVSGQLVGAGEVEGDDVCPPRTAGTAVDTGGREPPCGTHTRPARCDARV